MNPCVFPQRFTGNQIAKLRQNRPEEFQDTEVSLQSITVTFDPSTSLHVSDGLMCLVSEDLTGQQFCGVSLPRRLRCHRLQRRYQPDFTRLF